MGDCRLVGAGGGDPHASCMKLSGCGTNGTCDGNGGCAFARAGTTCGPATCQNKNFVVPASTCNGTGQCLPGAGMTKCDKGGTCNNGVCGGG
jgi:hypothetical protein